MVRDNDSFIYGDTTVSAKRRMKGKLGRGRGKKDMYAQKIRDENLNLEDSNSDVFEDDDLQVIAEAEWDSDDDLYKQEAARRA